MSLFIYFSTCETFCPPPPTEILHMARKNRTPEENARLEKIRELLQMANIGSMDDI